MDFGPYPFLDEKYGMAQIKGNGVIGNQTISNFREVNEDWDYHYIRAIANQWFGSALTCATWNDIWLIEKKT